MGAPPNAIAKICCLCQKDVSQQKRTRDQVGRYYCQTCSLKLTAPQKSETIVAIDPNRSQRDTEVIPIEDKMRERDVGVGQSANVPSHPNGNFILSLKNTLRDILRLAMYAAIGFVAIVIVVASVIMFKIYFPSSNTDATTASPANAAPPVAPMPTITVVGDTDHDLTFSNWTTGFANIKGILVWNGHGAIDSITFTIKRDGVVKERGDLDIPGGGMRKDEPTEVKIGTAVDLDAATEIVITVQY